MTMDQIDKDQLYNTCWKHWGADTQIDMAIEEMAEFTHAILRCRRQDFRYNEKFFEELADVLICFEQIETRLKLLPHDIKYEKKPLAYTAWDKVTEIKEDLAKNVPHKLWKENMDILIKKMAQFTEMIIATRQNNVTYSYAFFEGFAGVLQCMDQLEKTLKKRIRASKNHVVGDNGTLWDGVMEIKEEKLERLKSRLFDSLDRKHPNLSCSIMGSGR